MGAPQVTIVVPVHNGQRFLSQALESIAAQTFTDWEAVIVDDASVDGSLDLARGFAERHADKVKVVALERNVGVAGARNTAIRESAGGRLVVLLDQDDYLLDSYLDKMVKLFDEADARGRPGIVAGNGWIETAEGTRQTFAEHYWWSDVVDYERMLRCNYIQARAMFSRAAFDEVGGFDPACLTADDYDLWLRLLEAGYEVVTTRESLFVYRIHDGAQSRDKRRLADGSLAAYRRALERGALTARQRRILRGRIRHYRAVRDGAAAARAVSDGRRWHAARLALTAAPWALMAFLQAPRRWVEWLRELLLRGTAPLGGVAARAAPPGAVMGRGRRILRRSVFRILRLSLIPLIVRETLQRKRVTLILYHDPDPQAFERHLQALRRCYTIIDLRSFIDALRNGTMSALPRKSIVITLDDGYRGNRALLPVCERLGVPITVFLCASIVGTNRRFWAKHVEDVGALTQVSDGERLERLRRRGFAEGGDDPEALSDEEILSMAGPYVEFQSHGLSHPVLSRCDDAKAQAEIVDSREALSSRYGLDIYAFSYPHGGYSERELALVREGGYRCGVTIDLGFNTDTTDPYRLKRLCIDDRDGVDELLLKACGVWGAIRRLLHWRAAGDASSA